MHGACAMTDQPETPEGVGRDQVSRTAEPAGVVVRAPANVAGTKTPPKEVRNQAVIEALAMPGATVRQVAKDFDLSETRVRQIRDSAAEKIQKLRATDNRLIVEKLEDLIDRIQDSMTDEDIRKAPLSQRMIAMGIAVDKRQLLKGEATTIVGRERTAKINELLPAFMQEMQRRGLALPPPAEAPIDVVAEPVPVSQSSTAKEPDTEQSE